MNPRLRNALGALGRARQSVLVGDDSRALSALEGACRDLAAVAQQQDERLTAVERALAAIEIDPEAE